MFTGQSHRVILWLMIHACISSLDLSIDSSFTLFKYVILNMKLAPAQIKSLFYGKWVAFVRVEDYLKIHMKEFFKLMYSYTIDRVLLRSGN